MTDSERVFAVQILRRTTHRCTIRVSGATKAAAAYEARMLCRDEDYFDMIPDNEWEFVATEGYIVGTVLLDGAK